MVKQDVENGIQICSKNCQEKRLKPLRITNHMRHEGLKSKQAAGQTAHLVGFGRLYPAGFLKIVIMGYGINGFGFHLSMASMDFICPICECPHTEEDFESVVRKGKHDDYIKCKGCKRRLGFTIDLAGDIQVWEKS